MCPWRPCVLLLFFLLPGVLCSCGTPGTLGVKNIEGISELWISKGKSFEKADLAALDKNDFAIIRDRRFVQDIFRELAGQEPFKGSALNMEAARWCLFFRDNGSLVVAFCWWRYGIPRPNFDPWYIPGLDEASPAIGKMMSPKFRMAIPDFEWKILPYIDARDYATIELGEAFFTDAKKAESLKRLGKKKPRSSD